MSKKNKKNKEFDEAELLNDDGKDLVVKSNKKKNKKKNKTNVSELDDDAKFDLIISSGAADEIEAVQKSKKKGSKKKNLKKAELEDDPELEDFTDNEDEEIIPAPQTNNKKHTNDKPQDDSEDVNLKKNEEQENEVDNICEQIDELTTEEREATVDVDKKMTHKEKKKLKKQQEYEKQVELMTRKGGQGHSDLDSNFTMSQAQKTSGQKAQLEHAVDIKIENFTISAKGKYYIYI